MLLGNLGQSVFHLEIFLHFCLALGIFKLPLLYFFFFLAGQETEAAMNIRPETNTERCGTVILRLIVFLNANTLT